MNDRELMQQALDALEDYVPQHDKDDKPVGNTIDALRARLAEREPPCKTGSQCIGGKCDRCAEPEPLAWRNAAIRIGEDLSSVGPDGYYEMTAEQWLNWAIAQNPKGKTSLPQREWVGLTAEERKDIFKSCGVKDRGYVAALVEAKLKEKNAC